MLENPEPPREKQEDRKGRRGRTVVRCGDPSSDRRAKFPLDHDETTDTRFLEQQTRAQKERWVTVKKVIVQEWPGHSSPWECERCGAPWCRIWQPPEQPPLCGGQELMSRTPAGDFDQIGMLMRPPDGVLTRAGLNELGVSELKETQGLTTMQMKNVTNCSVCGKRGHWKGEPECQGKRDDRTTPRRC